MNVEWLEAWRLLRLVWILLFLILCLIFEPVAGVRASSGVKRTRKPRITTTTAGPTTTVNFTIPPPIIRTQKEIEAAMIKSQIIPDLFTEAPKKLQVVSVKFEGKSLANLGNHLSIRDLEYWAPFIHWKSDESEFYTLMMLNLDVPSRENPSQREWIVWLMTNIPGCWVMRGDELIEYEEPDPEKGTGSHRYVLLIYHQKQGKQKFREYAFNLIPGILHQECRRQKFNSRLFAADYSLGEPIGINFWETEWVQKIKVIPTMNYDYYEELMGYK
nr:PREDICTED: protein D1-like isoform X2 [Bemisia tabaci]